MVQSVLGSLILGYRPLWNRARKLAGVQLFAHSESTDSVDAAHLVRTLQEMWSSHSPQLLLSPQSPRLLNDFLDHAPEESPWIEVRSEWLTDSSVTSRIKSAHQRGLKLVWRGESNRIPDPITARCFDSSLLTLRPEDAVQALQAAAPLVRPLAGAASAATTGKVLPGQMYEGVQSRAVAEYCLDQNDAFALVDWPAEDVLYGLRHKAQQPSHAVVLKLMKAIDDEQSLETFEAIMGEDPLLAYRFMAYTNSAALGLRTGIDSLRRGMVMMGYSSIGRWLADQLPNACTDPNMQPVRQAMVFRARLMAHVLNAGVENDLRREIYLCGLLSQIDVLLNEPLGTALRRLPLSDRIYNAAVVGTGPYAGGLHMAKAMESDNVSMLRKVANSNGMALEDVNRALLRVLSELEASPRGNAI